MNLPRVLLHVGGEDLWAYVARSDEERAQGLMFVRELPADEGMLFMCDGRERHSFWMKDTPLPLSIAFVADDGRITQVEDLEPHSEEGCRCEQPVRFVLEVNQGWFAERGVGVGTAVEGPVFLD